MREVRPPSISETSWILLPSSRKFVQSSSPELVARRSETMDGMMDGRMDGWMDGSQSKNVYLSNYINI